MHNKAKFTCFVCRMVVSKRAIEKNEFLTSLVQLLQKLLECKPERPENEQEERIERMQRDILQIKDELREMKMRSAAVN